MTETPEVDADGVDDPGPSSGPGQGPVFRVYNMPESLRSAIRARRDALGGMPVRDFLSEAISRELGPLVAALEVLGLTSEAESGGRPARLPLSAALLDDLRGASERVGIPSSRLLRLCLCRAASRKRRRRVPVVSEGAGRGGRSTPAAIAAEDPGHTLQRGRIRAGRAIESAAFAAES